MRLFASLAATAILFGACGGTAAAPSPTPTPAPSTPTPSPTPTPPPTFKATLLSSNEVPPVVGPEASCTGDATVVIDGTTVKFTVNVKSCPSTVSVNISAGHIMEAPPTANGPVRVNTALAAGDFALTNGAGTLTKTVTTTPELATAIIANPGNFYINLHSAANPGGLIRGQLTKA